MVVTHFADRDPEGARVEHSGVGVGTHLAGERQLVLPFDAMVSDLFSAGRLAKRAAVQQSAFGEEDSVDERHRTQLVDYQYDLELVLLLAAQEAHGTGLAVSLSHWSLSG